MTTEGRKFTLRGMAAGDRAFAALFCLLEALVLATFRDYGLSYDELQASINMGKSIVRFFTTLGKDLASIQTSNFRFYGGFFDAPAALFLKISPFGEVDSHHLAIAATGLLGVLGVFLIGRRLGGPWAGFWGALFLALCAPFYGHIFMNPKDIPFAVAHIWCLWAMLRVYDEWPAPSVGKVLLLGFFLGAALGIRVGGAILVCYLFVLLALDFSLDVRAAGAGAALRRSSGGAARLAGALLIAYLLMIAFWPAAILNPVKMPFEAFAKFNDFDYDYALRWNGEWVRARALPRSYLPVLFFAELPEFLLLLAGVALPWAAWRLAVALQGGARSEAAPFLLLLLGALAAPTYAVAARVPMYDNMRHFLFILPPLAALCGGAWVWLLELLGARSRAAGLAALAVLSALLIWQAARTVALHPYEYVFKNAFVGGMPAAGEAFETDYWATAYREAAEAMVEHAKRVAAAEGVPFESRRFRVAVQEIPMNVAAHLPANFMTYFYASPEWVALGETFPTDERIAQLLRNTEPYADYVVTRTRLNAHRMSPIWDAVAKIERSGMLFAVVKARPELARIR